MIWVPKCKVNIGRFGGPSINILVFQFHLFLDLGVASSDFLAGLQTEQSAFCVKSLKNCKILWAVGFLSVFGMGVGGCGIIKVQHRFEFQIIFCG